MNEISENALTIFNPIIAKALKLASERWLKQPYTIMQPAIGPAENNQWTGHFEAQLNLGRDPRTGKPLITYRPNHGTAHSARKASYVPVIAQFLNTYGQHPFNRYSEEELRIAQLMCVFSVTGRKNEAGYNGIPGADMTDAQKKESTELYLTFRKESAQNFKRFVLENGLLNAQQAEHYAQAFEYNHDPRYTNDKVLKLYNYAHDLDLLRCYQPDKMVEKKQAILSIIDRNLPPNKRFQAENDLGLLMKFVYGCLRYTGTRVLCQVDQNGKIINGYNDYDTNFVDCNNNHEICLKALERQPTPPIGQVQMVMLSPNEDALARQKIAEEQAAQEKAAKDIAANQGDPSPKYKTIHFADINIHDLYDKTRTQKNWSIFSLFRDSNRTGQIANLQVIIKALEASPVNEQEKAEILLGALHAHENLLKGHPHSRLLAVIKAIKKDIYTDNQKEKPQDIVKHIQAFENFLGTHKFDKNQQISFDPKYKEQLRQVHDAAKSFKIDLLNQPQENNPNTRKNK